MPRLYPLPRNGNRARPHRARLGLGAARRPEPLHLRDVVAWDDVVRIDDGGVEVREPRPR